jgi:acyl-CoA reductase-like NAD-dependent aldehyde dehydrogenase
MANIDFHDEKNGVIPEIPLRLAGRDVFTEHRFQTINPGTGKTVAITSGAFVPEANAAVTSAQAAFHDWTKSKPEKKRNIFLRAADILEQRVPELCSYMQEETGATDTWCSFNVHTAAEMLRDVAGRIATIQGTIPETSDEGRTALVYKEAWGVILAIAPW